MPLSPRQSRPWSATDPWSPEACRRRNAISKRRSGALARGRAEQEHIPCVSSWTSRPASRPAGCAASAAIPWPWQRRWHANARGHEVVVAMNGALGDTVDADPRRLRRAGSQGAHGRLVAAGRRRFPDRRQPVAHSGGGTAPRAFPGIACVPTSSMSRACSKGLVTMSATSVGRSRQDMPTAVTLYDLIPLAHQDVYLPKIPAVADWYARKLTSLRRADLLLAISDHSAREAFRVAGTRRRIVSGRSPRPPIRCSAPPNRRRARSAEAGR